MVSEQSPFAMPTPNIAMIFQNFLVNSLMQTYLDCGGEHDDVVHRVQENAGAGAHHAHRADGLLLAAVLHRHVAAGRRVYLWV